MAKITYTDKTTANTSPLPTTQKFTSGDANEIKASVNALYDAAPKVYAGYISQSGTDAPTVVELVNELGGTPVFSYDIPGQYIATLAGAFGATRTSFWLGPAVSGDAIIPDATVLSVSAETDNTLLFISGKVGDTSFDDILNSAYFEIKIYP